MSVCVVATQYNFCLGVANLTEDSSPSEKLSDKNKEKELLRKGSEVAHQQLILMSRKLSRHTGNLIM